MGFRGEALASIGGVAKVHAPVPAAGTRTHGAELRCDGGAFAPVRPWNGSPGTRVEVRHLFAQRPGAEEVPQGAIPTELGNTSARPSPASPWPTPTLHLTLRHNGKLVYEVPASGHDWWTGSPCSSGREVRDALLAVDGPPRPGRG